MKRFDLHTWKIASAGERELVLRPTARTILTRLGVTIICLIFISMLGWGLYNNQQQQSAELTEREQQQKREMDQLANEMTEDMVGRGLITQEEIDEINRKSQERVDKARADLRASNEKIRLAFWCGIGFFAFFGLLSPTSLLWEKVSFSRTIRDELLVRRRDSVLWTKKVYYPEQSIHQISVMSGEHLTGDRQSRHRRAGWMWAVYAQGDGGDGFAIAVDLSPGRPLENRRLPEKVETIATALSAFTGAPLRPGYTVTNIDSIQHGLSGTKIHRSGVHTTTRSLGSTRKEYSSLDELPPEIQAKFREAQARGETGPVHVERTQSVQFTPGQPITYRSPDGTEHTYNSIEEMPPEIQKIFRDLQQ